MQLVQVSTTVGSREEAERLATSLVEQRLAGCVQVEGPIMSVYRWEGEVRQETEWRCLCKTRHDLFAPLETALRAIHPYAVPQILAVPIVEAHAPYRAWLEEQLVPPRDSGELA